MRLEGTRVKMEKFGRCYQATRFGNPFVIDLSYFDKMNLQATKSASKEIQRCIGLVNESYSKITLRNPTEKSDFQSSFEFLAQSCTGSDCTGNS